MSRDILTLQDAARRLDVHYMTAYRYVRLGLLPAFKEGGTWRVREEDLERFRSETVSPTTRGEARWAERLEARLTAGDAGGAWQVIEASLASGKDPSQVYTEILTPALTSIGERWMRGELGVDDEHIASAIASRLIGRLGPRFARRGRSRGRIIAAMPQGERHGFGLAMLSDVLRGAGYEVLDLGPDTPTESLVTALRKVDRVDAVCVSVVYNHALAGAKEMVSAVKQEDPSIPVIVGGFAVTGWEMAREMGADGWAPDSSAAAELVDRLIHS